jgi:hypothetical protein
MTNVNFSERAPNADWCRDCETRGQKIPATRGTPGGTRLCDLHWRQRTGAKLFVPAAAKVEKKEIVKMPARKAVDWGAVQRDRDAGAPVTELVEKYGVSNFTIYAHTKKDENMNGKKTAGGGIAGKLHVTGGKIRVKGSVKTFGDVGSMISELEAQRGRIDLAISALRALEGA